MRFVVICVFCLTLAGCGLDETLHRSDKPTSREAATKDISVPLPSSAKDIYYVVHSGGVQEFQLFVRFAVDPKDLDKAVGDILSDYDKTRGEHNSYTSVPVVDGPRWSQFNGMVRALLPMTWWDTDSITNGYYRGPSNDFGNIHIWADVSHHIIFLCEHD